MIQEVRISLFLVEFLIIFYGFGYTYQSLVFFGWCLINQLSWKVNCRRDKQGKVKLGFKKTGAM